MTAAGAGHGRHAGVVVRRKVPPVRLHAPRARVAAARALVRRCWHRQGHGRRPRAHGGRGGHLGTVMALGWLPHLCGHGCAPTTHLHRHWHIHVAMHGAGSGMGRLAGAGARASGVRAGRRVRDSCQRWRAPILGVIHGRCTRQRGHSPRGACMAPAAYWNRWWCAQSASLACVRSANQCALWRVL